MKPIHPNLFTQVMKLPAGIRGDVLEFLGATQVEDAHIRRIIAEVAEHSRRKWGNDESAPANG